jgi:hypothetical protein
MTTFRGVMPLDPAATQYALGYRYVVVTAEVTISAGVVTALNTAVGGSITGSVTLVSLVYTAARTSSEGEAGSVVIGTTTPGSTETAAFEPVRRGETEGRRIIRFDKSLTPPGSPGALLFHCVHYGLVGNVFTAGGSSELADGPLTGPGGLKAKYYTNVDFTGLPAFEATELINITRQTQVSTLNMGKFAARWVGYIRPAVTGNYRFRMTSDGRGRLTIGDNIYIDDWGSNSRRVTTGPAKALVAGKDTFIKMEMNNTSLGWEAKLEWETPATPGSFVLVPTSVMYFGANVTIIPPRQEGASHYVQSVNRYLEA